MLAAYTAGTVLLISAVILLVFYLCLKGHAQAVLCTECQQCKSFCPMLSRGCDPVAIMKAAKSGRGDMITSCIGCRACTKGCPQGLEPYREASKWKGAGLKNEVQEWKVGA
jgi:Na+-translocating ferredoxin:NAD+ oxidoreductase RnfC subunit